MQIRPIVDNYESNTRIAEEIKEEETIICSNSALGNGRYEGIHDLVYVKPETFSNMNTRKIASAVAKINKEFSESNSNYVLVGPGRWGSSDPWLGIPVIWPQIANAKIIVEAGLNNYRIDPSQGTHFFQNLTSFKVGYLTINPFMGDGFFDLDYLNKLKAVYEDGFLRHVRFEKPLVIIIEGKQNKAVIYKEGYPEEESDSLLNASLDELPPEGFM